MVDDHSRLAYAELLDDLTAASAVAFLRRAVAWFAARGVRVQAVMSDNGGCYTAHDYATAAHALGLRLSASAPTGHAPTARRSD
jgi:integrase-like protein